MLIKLFDIVNNKVVPTEHCYTISSLKDIMELYPDDYLKVYTYLFYMTCPNPDLNPFFNVPEHEKEEIIMTEIDMDISTEDDLIIRAMSTCQKLYETPRIEHM